MTFDEFQQSLQQNAPPEDLEGCLLSLWWAGKDNWEKAHGIAQDIPGSDGAWVHAYLHRVEGDLGNAGYWYARAGKKPHAGSTDAEWQDLIKVFL